MKDDQKNVYTKYLRCLEEYLQLSNTLFTDVFDHCAEV